MGTIGSEGTEKARRSADPSHSRGTGHPTSRGWPTFVGGLARGARILVLLTDKDGPVGIKARRLRPAAASVPWCYLWKLLSIGSCPGRAAACNAAAQSRDPGGHAFCCNLGPGSAAHRQQALRCVRGTRKLWWQQLLPHRHCERSEAIQNPFAERLWIASLRSQWRSVGDSVAPSIHPLHKMRARR